MKRVLAFVLLFVALFSLTACEKKDTSKINTISAAQLTEREKLLLVSTSEHYAVFEFNVDKKYNHLAVWIEKYEHGKKVALEAGELSSPIENKGTIILSKVRNGNNTPNNKVVFNLSINSNGGMGTATFDDQIKDAEVSSMSTWQSNEEENIQISDKMVLAGFCLAGQDQKGMSSLTKEFFNDYKNKLDEIKDYDVTYLLKYKFTTVN